MEFHLSCVGVVVEDICFTRKKAREIKIICNKCYKHLKEIGELRNYISSLKKEFISSASEIGDLKASIEII